MFPQPSTHSDILVLMELSVALESLLAFQPQWSETPPQIDLFNPQIDLLNTPGPQLPCDSGLANESACIPSATLIDQGRACAPIRTMTPQEICSFVERRVDFFCLGLSLMVAICHTWNIRMKQKWADPRGRLDLSLKLVTPRIYRYQFIPSPSPPRTSCLYTLWSTSNTISSQVGKFPSSTPRSP